MTMKSKKVVRSSRSGRYVPLTVGQAEKRSGVKYDAPADQTLVEYLNKHGSRALGDLLQRTEKHLAK